jgi:diguanylate cyclase (GGDEF)-like protein/PAS domain S-box-containing protein
MTIFPSLAIRSFCNTAIPYAVALAGALLTLWLAREVRLNDEAQLDRRFQREARERIEPAERLLARQAYPLDAIQRALSAADEIDAAALARIVEPLSQGTRLHGFAWAPRITAAQRAGFERGESARQDSPFAISEFNAERRLVPAAPREVYFPIAFGVPPGMHSSVAGLDLASLPELCPLIDESAAEGAARSSEGGSLPFAPVPALGGMTVLIVPVHAAGPVPAHGDARRAAIRGVLVATLDVVALFDAAFSSGGSGLRVSLSDMARERQGTQEAQEARLLRRWPPDDADEDPSGRHDSREYSRDFTLAGHSWNVRVEPDSSGFPAQATHWAAYLAVCGLLLSLVSFLGLRGLLKRSTRVEEIERTHSDMMARLRESENRFRSAMAVMAEGLMLVSPDSVCRFANRTAKEILQVQGQILQGRDMRQLPLQFLDVDGKEIPNPLENGRLMSLLCAKRELRNSIAGLRFDDGTVRWLEISTSPLHTGEDPPRMVVTFSDITARREVEEKSHMAFEAIRYSGEGIVMTNAEQRIIMANPAFETMTGFGVAEVIGKTPRIFSPEWQPEDFLDDVKRSLESTGHWQGEIWNRRKNGEGFPEWRGISAVREACGRAKYYVHVFADMSEHKAAQKRIEFLAHHDPLTGLPNRVLLRDRMLQAMARASRAHTRVAMLFLDLDRFKQINDSLGHPAGDALLKAIAARLNECVRKSDTICRQGGDEFIIVLDGVRDAEAVAGVADNIHRLMAQPFDIGGYSLITSFSIGVAIYPDDGADFDVLMQEADTAMYHAKEAGRNHYRFFTEQMNQRALEHMLMETRLRGALDNAEFVLYYQPQADLTTRAIVGVEALIRWNSPENGLVQPAKFIPVAEETGLIVDIGAWVLREACRQAKAWQDAGLPPMVVAVNLSAIQFRRSDMIDTVVDALAQSGLSAEWLELELTESVLLQDTEAMLDTVRRLKALGLKLSVDDFGTGYSSLAYLKRFSVDKLKIDQSFIFDLLTDSDNAAIVRAIIQMAHSLKLRTIAEGVENEALSEMLKHFQCDDVQGYGLARPMPAEALEAFLRGYTAKMKLPCRGAAEISGHRI